MRLPAILAFALTMTALAAPVSRAQTAFTNADVSGRYAFSLRSDNENNNGFGFGFGFSSPSQALSATGWLEADGMGGITAGVRYLRRSTSELSPIFGTFHPQYEELEQTVTGTYVVQPDGTGRMTLETSDISPWVVWTGSAYELSLNAPTETVRFVLVNGGDEMKLSQVLVASVTYLPDPTLPFPDYEFALLGDASRGRTGQDVGAQLCEILRLLHTPQGRRASDSAEVEAACGQTYAWNQE